MGRFELKFQTEGTLPTNQCWCQSSRVIVYNVWYQNICSTLFGFGTNHDMQTGGQN